MTGRDFSREGFSGTSEWSSTDGCEERRSTGNKCRRASAKKNREETLESQQAKGRAPRTRTKAKESQNNHNNLSNTNRVSVPRFFVEQVEHGGTNVQTPALAKYAELRIGLACSV